MDEGGFNRYWKCRAISDGASLSSSHFRKWSDGFVEVSLKTTSLRLFLSDLLQNDCSQSLHAHHLNISPFNGNAWRGCHELWQSCSKTAIRLNNACWLTWFVLKLFMLSPSTGLHWYRWWGEGRGVNIRLWHLGEKISNKELLRQHCYLGKLFWGS